jgi:hypothetical protein
MASTYEPARHCVTVVLNNLVTAVVAGTAGNIAALDAAEAAEFDAQIRLLREILGNPFRRVAFPPSWQKPDVIRLARSIFDNGCTG